MVTRKKVVTRKRIIIATILLVIAFLLLDVFIDSIFFHEGSFLDEILSPSPYELYIRTLCSVFMLGAGIFMAQAYGRELKTESKLRNLSGIVESSDDAILSLTLKGVITSWNLGAEKIYGYSAAEMVGQTPSLLIPLDRRDELPELLEQIVRRGHIEHFETVRLKKDGGEVQVSVSFSPITDEKGNVIGASLIAHDITAHKLMDEKLQESEDKFRILAEQSPNMIFINQRGKIVFANHRCEEVMGYKEKELYAPDFDFMTLVAPENRDQLRENFGAHLALKDVPPGDYSLFTKDGRRVSVILATKLIDFSGGKAIVGVLTDITERIKMQEQLIAQDRLSSIGQLVAGVAHEINNPLTSVIGFSDLLLGRNLSEDVKADLKIVHDEGQRAAKIVRNLLTFSRQQPERKDNIQAAEPLKAVLILREYQQKANNILVITHFAENLPWIYANISQLEQVFLNLVINAEQAMLEAHGKGTIDITTEQSGDFIKISFADDGPGISPENMNKLFTPFFTTKGVGKGTGLGLSISHGIITEHGGKIYAEDNQKGGATFIIELPIAKKSLNP